VKLPRKAISMTRKLYDELTARSEELGIARAQIVEQLVKLYLAGGLDVDRDLEPARPGRETTGSDRAPNRVARAVLARRGFHPMSRAEVAYALERLAERNGARP
jgi:hypothetical protein